MNGLAELQRVLFHPVIVFNVRVFPACLGLTFYLRELITCVRVLTEKLR
jgi:hypothetical protein